MNTANMSNNIFPDNNPAPQTNKERKKEKKPDINIILGVSYLSCFIAINVRMKKLKIVNGMNQPLVIKLVYSKIPIIPVWFPGSGNIIF